MSSTSPALIIGYIGGSILAVQLIPQIVKVIRRKSAKDLSYVTLCLYIIGGTLTIVYGILIDQPPIFATVSFSLTCNVSLLLMKLLFDLRDKKKLYTIQNHTPVQV